jgi:large subunit ribosomal protein L25
MEKLVVSVQSRELAKEKARELRRKNYIPGIVYGSKSENKLIKVNREEFEKVFREIGESTLINLKIDSQEVGKVIINDYQVDPVDGNIIHFDLYQVRMDKKIIAKIHIKFVGEPPAVKNEGGVLVKSHDKLEIKCLPADLIHDLEVDISKLENVDDLIRIKDLKVSDRIEVLSDPEEVIVSIMPPRSEKEMEKLESEVEENIEGVEGTVKEKEEEDNKEESSEKSGEPEKSEKSEEENKEKK